MKSTVKVWLLLVATGAAIAAVWGGETGDGLLVVLALLLGEATAIAMLGGAIGLGIASVLCIGIRSFPAFIQET
ncbi:MAG: hypothetical protein SNJ60_05530, partial [Pseudanabaenaceae cyanobacterium]